MAPPEPLHQDPVPARAVVQAPHSDASVRQYEADAQHSRERVAPGWREIIEVAVCVAALTSVGEIAAIALEKYGLGSLVHHAGTHVLWMIPAGNLAVFVSVAFVLAAASRLWPGRVTLRGAVTVFAALMMLAWLIIVRRHLHEAAVALLAAGAGLQAGILADRHRQWMRRWVRRGAPAVLAASALLAVAIPVADLSRERHGLARLAAAPAGVRNVILIILDTVRSPSLSNAPHASSAPPLDALLSRGFVFEHATAPASWTLPSHASFFTGRWPHELPPFWRRPLGDTVPLLAEELRDRGYLTAGFTANLIVNHESGLTRGFVHYESFPATIAQVLNTPSLLKALQRSAFLDRITGFHDVPARKSAADVTRRFLDWRARAGNRPYFAFLNYYDAHAPYLPPPPYGPLGSKRRPRLAEQLNLENVEPADIAVELDAYEGAIEYLDTQVAELITELDRRGELDNTVVVITSDHGEEFGEHGRSGHGHGVHRELVHVPLVIMPGGGLSGVVSQPVTLADLPATIIDLIGIADSPLPGVSLRSTWDPSVAARPRPAFSIEEGYASIMTETHHYIRRPDGSEALYDLQADRTEHRDLAAEASADVVLQELRSVLQRSLETDRTGHRQ